MRKTGAKCTAECSVIVLLEAAHRADLLLVVHGRQGWFPTLNSRHPKEEGIVLVGVGSVVAQ